MPALTEPPEARRERARPSVTPAGIVWRRASWPPSLWGPCVTRGSPTGLQAAAAGAGRGPNGVPSQRRSARLCPPSRGRAHPTRGEGQRGAVCLRGQHGQLGRRTAERLRGHARPSPPRSPPRTRRPVTSRRSESRLGGGQVRVVPTAGGDGYPGDAPSATDSAPARLAGCVCARLSFQDSEEAEGEGGVAGPRGGCGWVPCCLPAARPAARGCGQRGARRCPPWSPPSLSGRARVSQRLAGEGLRGSDDSAACSWCGADGSLLHRLPSLCCCPDVGCPGCAGVRWPVKGWEHTARL